MRKTANCLFKGPLKMETLAIASLPGDTNESGKIEHNGVQVLVSPATDGLLSQLWGNLAINPSGFLSSISLGFGPVGVSFFNRRICFRDVDHLKFTVIVPADLQLVCITGLLF